MNNLSSYCGLVDAKIRDSEKDLLAYINIAMAALCRIRTPEAYKEANEFFADEFLFQKKCTQVEQKNVGFLDLKFDRNKKRQETDSSGKKHFLPEYLVHALGSYKKY